MIFSLHPIDLAVALATVLGIGMLVPQSVEMARTKNLNGVSGAWIGGGVAINGGWLVYALAADLAGLLPVSMGALAIYIAMASMVARGSLAMFYRLAVGAIIVAAMFTVAGLAGGTPMLGLTIALIYAAQFSPAAWAALRAEDLSGVSALTWVMALAEAAIWAVYGQYRGDFALTVGGAGAVFMSALVLVGLWRSAQPLDDHGHALAAADAH